MVEQLLAELRTNAGWFDDALMAAVGIDTCAVVERKDVRQGDGVAFHALNFSDGHDAP